MSAANATGEQRRFRGASLSWLSSPAREARARLAMQLAYVALADAEQARHPTTMDPWTGRETRHPETPEGHAEARRLDALSDQLAREARRLCWRVRGLGDALQEVETTAHAMRHAAEQRDIAEREVADLIYDDGSPDGPAVLVVDGVTCAVGSIGAGVYACIDCEGQPIGARGTPKAWTELDRDPEWTASRAAAVFVAREGVEAAMRAAHAAEDSADAPESSAVDGSATLRGNAAAPGSTSAKGSEEYGDV